MTPAKLSQAYLPLAGGTMSGALVLSADPSAALGAVTKQYADGYLGGQVVSALSSITNGQVLAWNSSTSKWEPATVSGGGAATSIISKNIDSSSAPSVTGQTLTYNTGGGGKWELGTVAVTSGGTGVTTVGSGNQFFGSPNGAGGVPSFRALVAADLPQYTGGDVTTAAAGSVSLSIGAGKVLSTMLSSSAVTAGAIASSSVTDAHIAAAAAIAVTKIAAGTDGQVLQMYGTTPTWGTGFVRNSVAEGRLTLTTATPVTTSDVTAATTLYFTPYHGDAIALYDGTRWLMYNFTELSIALGTCCNTANTNYDIFIYNNAGTLTLEATAWTNDTTRATALTTAVGGVHLKTGATTRRYLGTIRTVAAGQVDDRAQKRYVWNVQNPIPTRNFSGPTSDWQTTAAGWTAIAAAVWKHEFVVGLAEQPIKAIAQIASVNTATNAYSLGLALDGTAPAANNGNVLIEAYYTGANSANVGVQSMLMDFPSAGYHYIQGIETEASGFGTSWLYGQRVQAGCGTTGTMCLQSGLVTEFWR